MTSRVHRRTVAARLVALGTLVLLTAHAAWAQPGPPALTAPVNDFADVIDGRSEQALDDVIRRLRAASGDTVVVATVKTFQPWPDIRAFATAMFANAGRGIGDKGKDNGMLVLLAVDDRQVWVEVGYDLEGVVTDGFAGETSRQVMAPYFRQGDYGGGLLAGTSRLIARIADDRRVSVTGVEVRDAPERTRDPVSPRVLFLVILLLFVVLPILTRRSRANRLRGWRGGAGRWGGGYYGGTWGGGSSWGGSSGGFGGFGGGRSGGGGGGASW